MEAFLPDLFMRDCESMVHAQICEMWVYDNILNFPIIFSIDLV
jgi:hypothetical protein